MREEPIVIANRAYARIAHALDALTGQTRAKRSAEIDVRTVGRTGASEPIDELRAHVFAGFEALAVDMGAEVDVRTG